MKIVVLDGYTLNPGDLSWDGLKSLGNCEFYDRSSPAEVLKRAGGAEMVLVNKIVLSRETIFSLPHLKYIGVTATGYNIVDVVAARERGIAVTNVPSYGTRSVAQRPTQRWKWAPTLSGGPDMGPEPAVVRSSPAQRRPVAGCQDRAQASRSD